VHRTPNKVVSEKRPTPKANFLEGFLAASRHLTLPGCNPLKKRYDLLHTEKGQDTLCR
jgi:hypothetical protein